MQRLWFLAAFLATAAFADTRVEEPEPVDIQNARFLQQPSGRDFVENYPPDAAAQSVQGSATIECFVELDTTTQCQVTAEAPMGWGFGAAALEISRTFRVAPATVNGVPTRGGRIRRTIRFVLPDEVDQSDWTPWDRAFHALNPPPDLPHWDDAPNFYAVLDAYPAAERRARVRGRAVLACTVRQDHRLNCENHSERPAGRGFGAAAMALSPQFRVAESYSDFADRHRVEPFLLPIFFGDESAMVPTDVFFTGLEPMRMPPLTLGPRDLYSAAAPPTSRGTVIALCTVQDPPSAACVIEQETPLGQGLGDFVLGALSTAPVDEYPAVPGDQMRFEFNFELP
jgi:TonB family protein